MPRYSLAVAEDTYQLEVSQASASWTAGEYVEMRSTDLPEYTGSVDVVPTGSAQVLSTAGTALATNIIVEPIPSNYGLITWDGQTITVS